MIPIGSEPVLNRALAILSEFGAETGVRGRFVALYLGLRRMGTQITSLGSGSSTPAGDIERFLDDLFTKTYRQQPFAVLTAPFGQSTSPTAPYSARSGVQAPGHQYPTNTWRNNFGIQKGVGCPADSSVVDALLNNPMVRLACPHMAVDPENRYVCSLANTAYRGEEHAIWLRITPDGYQVVDLNRPAVYQKYLQPAGRRIPVFPLIAALYCMASSTTYPARQTVGIPDFADDFGFALAQVEDLFDCDPDGIENRMLLTEITGAPLAGARVPAATTAEEPAPELPVLSPAAEINTGVGAELAVANELIRWGWRVIYRGNQRGFGYDLEATRSGVTLRIEVKSSVAFTSPELTESEWAAAQTYGDEYVLAVVDFYGSEQQSIWYVRNPAGSADPVVQTTAVYRLLRADIQSLSTEAEFL